MEDVLIGLLAIGIGAAFCFRGYLSMRLVFPLWGALVGFGFGATLVTSFTSESFLGSLLGWVVGLAFAVVFAILAYVIWSGRMSCWKRGGDVGRYGRDAMRDPAGWFRPSSGNHAFDEYRTETLRRLEEEQREFKEFLERLRFAKDKNEFDQFMAERRNRPGSSNPPQPQS